MSSYFRPGLMAAPTLSKPHTKWSVEPNEGLYDGTASALSSLLKYELLRVR
jgi:hypothetical protein